MLFKDLKKCVGIIAGILPYLLLQLGRKCQDHGKFGESNIKRLNLTLRQGCMYLGIDEPVTLRRILSTFLENQRVIYL